MGHIYERDFQSHNKRYIETLVTLKNEQSTQKSARQEVGASPFRNNINNAPCHEMESLFREKKTKKKIYIKNIYTSEGVDYDVPPTKFFNHFFSLF